MIEEKRDITVKHLVLDSGVELMSSVDHTDWETKGYVLLLDPFMLEFNPMLAYMRGSQDSIGLTPWCPWSEENVVLKLDRIMAIVTVEKIMEDRYSVLVTKTAKAKKDWNDKEAARLERGGTIADAVNEIGESSDDDIAEDFIKEFLGGGKKTLH